MPAPPRDRIRAATVDDCTQLLRLWELLFENDDAAAHQLWKAHARNWFARFVAEPDWACFPVVEVDGNIVATAIGTLEIGVPNPYCRRGRTVRLANVITLPEHRGNGYASLLVREVIGWARSVSADRVDLSATPDGRAIYERLGFVLTTAARMKLVLEPG